MSDSVRPHGWQPTRLPCPWDSPGKNTGVGCHFLLQCMKVKSERDVAQSCPTLSDPMDFSLPGSSIHGIFQARVLAWGAIVFSKLLTNGGQIWATLFSFIWMSTRYIGCALDVFLLITFTDQVLSHFKHEVKWSESHSVMSDSILTHRILWWFVTQH